MKITQMLLFAIVLLAGTMTNPLQSVVEGRMVLTMAEAGCEPNCDQPTAVQRGQKVPVWKVLYCVVGKPGEYRRIDCQDPRAVHRTPTGNDGVCFIGSDGKPHWDYQWAVHEGRRFINHRIGGRWQPDWHDDHSKWQ